MKKLAIVGSGLTGSLLGIFLARQGYDVDVFERLPDLRKELSNNNRSINLAISSRGWLALEKAGISEPIRQISVPMKGRMVHNLSGDLSFQPYSRLKDNVIYPVSRRALNNELLNATEQFPNLRIRFNEYCISADLVTGKLSIENGFTKHSYSKSYNHVFAGAFSMVRKQMQSTQHILFVEKYLKEGYKELTILANEDGSHKMEKNALHIWPRNEFMLIALPNSDGSFTATIFLPFEGEYSFSSLNTLSKIQDFFTKFFPDFILVTTNLADQFVSKSASSIVYNECFPWSYKDKFLLIGDAAHAIVPFYGQGMNCAFEDVYILDVMIKSCGADWTDVFQIYEKKENRIQMRFHNFR